jgi:polyisoprenyl-teichoic acid--peptidoglycan teichoic acid transferase
MSVNDDDKPPRVAWGMYKRFALAGVLITCLTAGAVASAGLLEVKDLVTVIRDESAGHVIPGLKGALDDVSAGKPQTILVLGSDRRFVDIK